MYVRHEAVAISFSGLTASSGAGKRGESSSWRTPWCTATPTTPGGTAGRSPVGWSGENPPVPLLVRRHRHGRRRGRVTPRNLCEYLLRVLHIGLDYEVLEGGPLSDTHVDLHVNFADLAEQ